MSAQTLGRFVKKAGFIGRTYTNRRGSFRIMLNVIQQDAFTLVDGENSSMIHSFTAQDVVLYDNSANPTTIDIQDPSAKILRDYSESPYWGLLVM